jgi:hypothetical protein
MSTLVEPRPPAAVAATPASRVPEYLVIGGSAVAPLNLLIVRSLTVYDVLIAVALWSLVHRRELVWPGKHYLALSYVFVVITLLSAFRATYATEAMTQTLQYVFVLFVQVPVIVSVVTTRRRAVASIALLCVGTLGAILHAYLTQSTQGSGRVLVFYSENPNRLGYPAAYLVPMLLALWFIARESRQAVRILSAVGVLVGLYLSIWAVSASGSRSSLVGTVAALLVYVVLRPGLGLLRSVGRLVTLCLVCGAVGTALAVTGQLPATLEERITRSLDNSDPDAQSHLVADREHLANAGVRAFMESPLLGTGLDNFRYVTPRYDLDATPQLPHNLWLQLLVQVGAIGTAAMALYLLAWVREMTVRARRVHPLDTQVMWCLVASLAGVLVIFMFAPEMLDRHYWLIVALGLATLQGTRADATAERTTDP